MSTRSVAEQNLELWSSWTQSPQISVTCLDGQIHFPRKLLAARSPHFRRIIEQQEQGDGSEDIRLEEVGLPTLKRFQRWCMSENPSIPDDTDPSDLLDLGILATDYQTYALEHAVATEFDRRLNGNDSGEKWSLRAELVARALQQCGPLSCLGRIVREKLSSLPPQQLLDEWSEWSKLAATDAEVLLNLLKTMATKAAGFTNTRGRNGFPYPTQSIFYNPCRYHDHSRQGFAPLHNEQGFNAFLQPECPYRRTECFPNRIVTSQDLPAAEDEEAATTLDQTPAEEEEAMMAEEAPAEEEEAMMAEEVPAEEEAVTFCDEAAAKETAASCDNPSTSLVEETLAAEETPGAYDEPRAEPVVLCDKPAAAEPGPDECINPWEASKKSKKDKTKKRDPIWDEEVPVEEEPAPPWPKSKKDKKKKKRDPIWDEKVPVEEAAVDGTAMEDVPVPPALVEDESDEWVRLTGAERVR